jgi:alpha-glucoside transport system substrate-binding protein
MMRIHRRGRKSLAALTALAAAVALAGCGSGGDSGGSGDKSVTVWSSVDQPVQDGLNKVLQEKAKAKGISVKWQKVENINQLIMQKIQANDTPDIAFIPQPGVVGDIVKRGKPVPLDDVVDMAALEDNMIPGTLDSGTVNDKLYGLLVSANVKSLVFYPKKAWDKAGYKAPTTIDELNTLTEQIKSDGTPPWCMGIESDTATGWPATDWFEDLVMRYGGADEYNKWVKNETKFDSDVVRESAAEFEKLMFTEGNVLGGRKAIASTNFGTAGNPMFDAKPGCMMYKQGSFITGFFPKNVVANLDAEVGVFGFPPAEAGGENPVLGGGDMAVLLSDDASSKSVLKMLAETDIGNEAAKNSSFISPHKDFDVANYANDLTRQVAAVGTEATALLFDGSDQMPGEVGAGSFWKDVTAWIVGQQDLDTTLKNIDESWPAS